MSSRAKLYNNLFVKHIVSSKNIKRTFLQFEPLPENFSKILFYGNQVSDGTSLFIEFHDRRPVRLVGEESHKNHKNEHIRALLALLSYNH